MYSDTMSVTLFYTYSDTMSIPCLKKRMESSSILSVAGSGSPFVCFADIPPWGYPFPKGALESDCSYMVLYKPLIGMLSVGMTNNIGIYDHLVLRFKRNVDFRQIAAEHNGFAAGFDIAENQRGILLFRCSGG